ncbi:MAG: hypothetical protein QOJ76_1416, partial [Acidobacteriota bacterium]|nr:hypothetical protein [Acidobacteriota bacterium]
SVPLIISRMMRGTLSLIIGVMMRGTLSALFTFAFCLFTSAFSTVPVV